MSLGGRGGRAIHVINLDDSGPGSLRAAIDADGPRTIIFDVGGTITLRTPLTIRSGRVTIAGQTAPGGGITIRNRSLRVEADDVVIRFIRSRLGDQAGTSDDALSIGSGHRIIVDHVSASWGTDETLSASPNWRKGWKLGDVTVQWSIISESLCAPGPKGSHCYGSLVGTAQGGRISFHHNLWADHSARMPRPENLLAPGQDPRGALFDFRSNVIYNWGRGRAGYDDGPPAIVRSNFVDNAYIPGPDSTGRLVFDSRNPLGRGWFSGNAYDGAVMADQYSRVRALGDDFPLSRPVEMPPIAPDPALSAYARVLASAGDSLVRDSVDLRVVDGVRSKTGRLIMSQSDVGGWPPIASGEPWRDSDGDGLPDQWEVQHHLDPTDARDAARDANGDGYTNLEEWLNALAAPARSDANPILTPSADTRRHDPDAHQLRL
jgi:hypothetical protein